MNPGAILGCALGHKMFMCVSGSVITISYLNRLMYLKKREESFVYQMVTYGIEFYLAVNAYCTTCICSTSIQIQLKRTI